MLHNFIEVCNNKFGNQIVVTFKDGCIIISRGGKELTRWCYCNELLYVTDGYDVINASLGPGQTLELFNNDGNGDIVGQPPDKLKDKVYAKGGFVYIDYPKVDAAENAIDENDKNVDLEVSNIFMGGNKTYDSNSIILPLYTFYTHLTNPENKSVLNIPNYWRIINSSSYDVQVNALILFSKDIYE